MEIRRICAIITIDLKRVWRLSSPLCTFLCIDASHDFIIDIYWRIISQQFIAGVAKPGQRREIRRIVRHDAQMLGYLTGVTSSLRGSWVQIPPPAP